MAKLDVKVIDMVNGEITKVAYDGAEYVKTNEPVRKGDLFQLREGHYVCGGEVGAFYTTDKFSDGDVVIPTEYKGNATYTQTQGWGVAYRKISAQTAPTIEERVTALEADVASIKGEAKATTKRLTVGDKARVVGRESAHSAEIGDIVTIVRDDEDRQPYKCELDGENVGWFQEWELEAVDVAKQEPEIGEAVKPKLKAGDFVKFAGYGDLMVKVDLTINKAYEVVESGGYLAIVDDVGMARIAPLRKAPYKILSTEEVAKHRESEKWAKIGRKPGEFKKGDIVRIVGAPSGFAGHGVKLGEYHEVKAYHGVGVSGGNVYFSESESLNYVALADHIELIAPVAARFDK